MGRDILCVKKTISFQFFEGCITQILIGPFLNAFSHMEPVKTLDKIPFSYISKRSVYLQSLFSFCFLLTTKALQNFMRM